MAKRPIADGLSPEQRERAKQRALLRAKLEPRLGIRRNKSKVKYPPLRLDDFVREAWSIIEPGTELSWNWHMSDICDHLEAIAYGVLKRYDDYQPRDGKPALTEAIYKQIKSLLINMPPRSTKSIIISVMWPAWAFGEVDAGLRFLYSSYSQGLSWEHSRLCRTIIESEWYQSRYGERVKLKGDDNTAGRFSTTRGGKREAISTKSATTGKGGDILVADDPHNVIEGESLAERATVTRWFGQAFSTRLNNPAHGAKVVVMQRIHTDDLSGVLLQPGSTWERLIYRQEYEPERAEDGGILPPHMTALGYQDRRSEPDELLWPERFTPEVVANAKIELGEYGYAGQHQQRPSPAEGGMFKRGWWQRYSLQAFRAIKFRRLAIFADTAQKAEERHDYSVFLLAGLDALNDYYLLDLLRVRVEYPELLTTAVDFWRKQSAIYGRALPIVIEDKGSGISLIQSLKRGEVGRDPSIPDYTIRMAERRIKAPAIGFGADRKDLASFLRLDKATRALSVSPLVQASRVWVPEEAPWANDFFAETDVFPNGVHDDQVDVLVMALKWLSAHVSGSKVLRGSN